MSCVEAVSSCTALLRSADHNKGLYQLIKKKTTYFFKFLCKTELSVGAVLPLLPHLQGSSFVLSLNQLQ